MTPSRSALLAALLQAPADAAFARTYLAHGGHTWTFAGALDRHARWRNLPLTYCAYWLVTRDDARLSRVTAHPEP